VTGIIAWLNCHFHLLTITVMLTPNQIEQYHEDGFTLVEGAVPRDLLDELCQGTDEIVEAARGLTESDERYDLEYTHTPDVPKVRRLKSPFLHWPLFSRLVREACILDAVEDLIGHDLRLHNHKVNIKAPQYGAAVEWHQDWAFYPHSNDDGLAVGIYLDDVTAENGPMMIVPGSHKGPVYDHHADGYFCGAMDPTACDLDFGRAVPLMGPAGTMTLHHVRAIHGSDLNRSSRPRRFVIQGYFAADAWPLQGYIKNFDLETFDAKIVRGSPTSVPRVADVPVRMPLPEALNSGSIYENQNTLEHRYFATYEEVA
jgi:ectoine hydroxylase-related dioxygenase (phytanoyl-CoA dioxygenase family)